MVKPLVFKGDKRGKKRKLPHSDTNFQEHTGLDVTIDRSLAAEADNGDNWVTAEVATDIAGPIIFALPSSKPTCLASDAHGKIYTSELENLIEDNLATAEPHEVRQVWIATRVAGTEEVSFKGHHGRYLSCDKSGGLSATREAVSPEESFSCILSPNTPETFSIRTVRDKFLTVVDENKTPKVRGDAESISFHTTFRIRMQARFKPRLKADKESMVKEKVSRKELEEVVGRRLEEAEIKRLKKARIQGDYHEAILDVRVKGKHDKYS